MMKKIFILMFCMILLVGTVSAFEFDNGLKYENNDLKVSIENGYWFKIGEWFGLSKSLGTAELKSHKFVDEIRPVKLGTSVVMWYDFDFRDLYVNGFGDVEIINLETGEIIDRNYELLYWGNETYQVPNYVCNDFLNKNGTLGNECFQSGTKDKTRETWLPYNSKDIPKGKITMGLELNMFMDETLDIIWTVAGKKIKKHAVVTSGASETTDGDFTIFTFSNNGTFNVTGGGFDAEVLVVAGGGAGGQQGAGGGAGGYNHFAVFPLTEQNYFVVVGTGGNGIADRDFAGENGTLSSFDNLTMIGGGGGSGWGFVATSNIGGSGGGGAPRGAGATGGAGIVGQGFAGGTGNESDQIGGGGGGGSEVGGDSDDPPFGGDGNSNAIFNGTTLFYAGGGGGADMIGTDEGAGGAGGGGGGGNTSARCLNGIDGTGGGGGGDITNFVGCDGGNGIVIIRVLSTDVLPEINITLEAPVNNTNFTLTNNVIMNATIFAINNITNVTLYLNEVGNETNTTAGLNDTVWTFTKNMGEGDIFWTIEACNFDDECVNASEGQRVFNVNTTPQINYTDPTPINNFNSTTNNFFQVNVSVTEDLFKNITFDLYLKGGSLNDSITFTNNSRIQLWINLADADYSYNVTVATTTNQFNSTETRNITIHILAPLITLTKPDEIIESHVLNTNLTVNWTIIESSPDTCLLEYEGVNNTVVCFDNSTEINITNSINRTVTFYANDTFGNQNSTSRSWVYNFIETGSEFTTDVFETNNYTFAINVTTTQSVSSFTAFLNHNGTIHSADSSCVSGDCEIMTIIDIPLLNFGQSTENKTFFWQLSIFNGTGTSEINTSTQTQNVTAINFEECGSTTQTVNFTTHRESDRSLLATAFAATFESYLGTGTVKKISNFSGSGDNGYEFCIDQDETFIVNSKIDLSAEDFSNRHYDFVKDEFVNVSFDRQLFLVNSSVATTIIIEVKDQGLIPKEDIIVNISRFYAAIGQFVQIENQITDEFGQIVAKLVQNDAKYRFNFLTIDNLLLKTSEDITIACRSLICIIPFVLEDTTDEFERFENLTTYTSTLTFDNSTNIFTFTWADQRGESATTRLEVTRYQLNGSSIVCNVSSTSILSTLSCNVGGQSASYKAQSFRTTSEEDRRIRLLNIKVNDLTQIYGLEGLMWVFLLLFTTIGIGAFNPTIGASLYLAGFIIMGILQIISMPPEVFFANIVLTIIFIWAVNKR